MLDPKEENSKKQEEEDKNIIPIHDLPYISVTMTKNLKNLDDTRLDSAATVIKALIK